MYMYDDKGRIDVFLDGDHSREIYIMAAPTFRFPIKADLHCHSNASNEADEAVLERCNALKATASLSRFTGRPSNGGWISSPSPITIPWTAS